MAVGAIHFYRVTMEQMVLNIPALNRQAGMEMAMGGAAPLAEVMGPNEDLAKGMGIHNVLICGLCGLSNIVIHQLLESEL